MTTIPTLFVYFLYDHIPTFFYIFKKCFLLLVTLHLDLHDDSKCSANGQLYNLYKEKVLVEKYRS